MLREEKIYESLIQEVAHNKLSPPDSLRKGKSLRWRRIHITKLAPSFDPQRTYICVYAQAGRWSYFSLLGGAFGVPVLVSTNLSTRQAN